MTYGVHCYVYSETWADDRLHVMDSVKALGADAIEIVVGDDVVFDPKRTRRHAESLELDVMTGPGGHWPLDCDLSADAALSRQRGLEWHKRQVDVSAEAGAKAYYGCLYGHIGVIQRRIPPRDEYERTAEGLHKLAEYGQQHGVRIGLEAVSHFRSHIANTPAQIMALIRLADHDNLVAVMDTYHLVTEIRDFAAAVRTYADRLYAVHCCESDRGAPGGGLVPWGALFSELRSTGYDGYLILETYNSGNEQFAHSRGMFHNVCPDANSFVRESFAFLDRHTGEPSGA